MEYRRCGHSGILLPEISLGLWHNFGSVDSYDEARDMIIHAFERGVCHFDLANNYGPEPGSAEITFGRVLRENLASHRDEMFISSKAGHEMWPGVYGDNSSRKNLIASCNASLRRTGLEYFDVFYSHRYDGVTPVEETVGALIDIVKSGKALYAGISKYPAEIQRRAYRMLSEAGVPCLVSQYRASLLDRHALEENLEVARNAGSGFVCFSPLAQGLLTGRYLSGEIPEGSRAARPDGYLQRSEVTEEKIRIANALNKLARERGETLPQFAIAWLLSHHDVTSVIVGASSVKQLEETISASPAKPFSHDMQRRIEVILNSKENAPAVVKERRVYRKRRLSNIQ